MKMSDIFSPEDQNIFGTPKTKLAWRKLSGYGGEKIDKEGAFALLKEQVEDDERGKSDAALLMLAVCYEYGIGCEQDLEKAESIYMECTSYIDDVSEERFYAVRSDGNGDMEVTWNRIYELQRNCICAMFSFAPWISFRVNQAAEISFCGEAVYFPSLQKEHTKLIGEGLKINTTLTVLDISNVGVEKVEQIIEALKTNTTLTSLNLNGLEDEEAYMIGDVLMNNNSSLVSLNLSGNFGSKGVSMISKMLSINTTLTDLGLNC